MVSLCQGNHRWILEQSHARLQVRLPYLTWKVACPRPLADPPREVGSPRSLGAPTCKVAGPGPLPHTAREVAVPRTLPHTSWLPLNQNRSSKYKKEVHHFDFFSVPTTRPEKQKLVPCKKWLDQCTLLHTCTSTLDKSLFSGYHKHTAMLNFLLCT